MNYFARVLHYLRPYWKLAILSTLLIFAATLASLATPWPLVILVDNVLGGQPLPRVLQIIVAPFNHGRFSLLVFAVAAGLAVTIVQNALSVLDNYVNTKLHQGMALDFRADLFHHAQHLSLSFHDNRRTGTLVYAINSQGDAVARAVMIIPPLAQSLLTLAGMLWISIRIDWQLALLSLAVVPVLYYAVAYYMSHIQKRLVEVREMEGETLSIIHEALSMLRVIVAFGRENHEYRRFRDQGEQAMDARVDLTVRQTLFSLVVASTTAAGTALVLGLGAYDVLLGKLTTGQLLVVMNYIAGVYKPIEALSTTIGSLQELIVSLKIGFDLLDTESEVKDLPGAVQIQRPQGEIVFEDVDFNYKGRADTLKRINFRAGAGETIAIVGATGAGKSTLVSLIPRFYEAVGGRILLDGTDIRKCALRSLRDQISIVLQEPLLFSGTIADNIRYGRLDAPMADVISAAKAANSHDFIMRLPDKYETKIGETGAQLSGGERQRISVARAFLRNAPILILDEPTSSIDSKTESVILDALDRLMIGRTTFLVAHRLSTVRAAHKILVLSRGELVEQGSHEELLDVGGFYRQLWDAQTMAQRAAALAHKAGEEMSAPI